MMARMGRGEAAGPSEEELQAMLLQMREAPVEQVLAEVINVLFQTIQVKLGLADARVLIDVVGALMEATTGRIDPQLQAQVVQALSQLRLAQVEEERRLGIPPADPPQAPPAATQPRPSAVPGAAPGTDPSGGASRLWVPGR
jgi:hypothetical protein